MRIEALNINSFGMITERTFALEKGVNLFEGENESGKSTVSAFIKFMLYGLERRAAGSDISERERYINWKSGEASGSMTLFHEGKRYKIERRVRLTSVSESGRENYRETLSVIDTGSGASCFEGRVPGEVFLGIPKEVFENTAYIKQLGVAGVDANLVGEAIQNILFSADEKVNTGRAIDKLDLLRRSILHKNEKGGELYEKTLEKSRVDGELALAKDESSAQIAKEGEHAELTALIDASQKRLAYLRAASEAVNIYEVLGRFGSLHALKEKVDGLESEYGDFVKRNSHEGFFPDGEYVKELSACERNVIGARAELMRLESERSKLKYENAHDGRLESAASEIREAGGADAVRADFAAVSQKKRTLGVFCAVFGALSFLCIVSCALVILLLKFLLPLGIVLGALGVIFACAFSGCLFSKKKAAKAEADFLSRFGASEKEPLEEIISRAKNYDDEQRELFSLCSVTENEIGEKKRELDALEKEHEALASRWGREKGEPGALIAAADEVVRQAERMRLDIEKYKVPCESAERELRAYNEEELRRRFAALGIPDAGKINKTELSRETEFEQKKAETLNFRKIETEKQLIALGATAKNPTALFARSKELEKEISELAERHAAYMTAIEAISQGSKRLRAGVAPRLSRAAKGYMSRLTSGKYSEGGFSQGADGFSINFEYDGEYRRLEALSEGTKDAAYISLRLALSDLFCQAGECPLIFDESFAFLDDARTANLLDLLETSGRQSVIFSCRGRERELLGGKEYNLIRL